MKLKLLFLLLLASFSSFAQYTLIPDVNFEKRLIALGIDSGTADGKVLTSKISSLTILNVQSALITDLTGIQDFVSLKSLNCYSNQLTTLDVSKNTALTDLSCYSNQLTTLDVSKNTALTVLRCYSNQITSLDLSKNIGLTTLNCYSNKLVNLNIKNGNNASLTYLDCYYNYYLDCIQADATVPPSANNWQKDDTASYSVSTCYTYIPDSKFELALSAYDDISNDHQVPTANIASLTTLDVSSKNISILAGIEYFGALKTLDCSGNQLTNLDVSLNTVLTNFDCRKNLLTNLYVSSNNTLKTLNCSFNSLKNLDVSYNNIGLMSLDCSNNQLTTLDVSKNTGLTTLNCNSNKLVHLNIKNGKNSSLNYFNCSNNLDLSCIQADAVIPPSSNDWQKDATASYSVSTCYTYIPDSNFELALSYYDDIPNDHQVPTKNIVSLTSLNVTSSNITDLTGIKDFPVLTQLICRQNNLTSLDVSKNIQLTDLNCPYNKLTSLDITKNVNLIYFDCSTNDITALDVTKNVNLYYLYFNYNKLTTIDVSKNVGLSRLVCISNQLTSLDISKNVNLGLLACENNSLTSLNLKNWNNNLLSKTLSDFRNNPNLSCIEVDDPTYSNLNWASIKDATTIYSRNCSPYTSVPDVNFEKALIGLGLDSGTLDGKVLTSNIVSITSLDVSNKSIADLTGIEDFLALKNLSCASNQLTRLEVSINTNLTSLVCNSNLLPKLDVSKNINLTSLVCNSNQLTKLDVSKNVNLKNLDCSTNQLTTLDISKNLNLISLYCNDNSLLSLNLKNDNNIAFNKAILNFKGNPGLSCIEVDDATYSNTNWSNFKDITASYNVYCSPYTLIPDDNFERALIALGLDSVIDGKVLRSNIASLTSLDVRYKSISNLTGIREFLALTSLKCSWNKLAVLDISKNVNLTLLACDNNNLATLDVSKNVNLSQLDCYKNQLTTIDISKNVNLLYFNSQENKLSTLNVTKNIKLFQLNCSSNQLTTLDVSKNTILRELYCNSNQLTNFDVSKNTALTKLYCYLNDQLRTLDVSKNTALTILHCYSNQLSTLDVSKNIALTNLSCDSNQLSTLDVSKNTALKYLSCYSNQLSTLDVLNNVALKELYCHSNQLTTLDVSKNTVIDFLTCYSNKLTTLDVSKITTLSNLKCNDNLLVNLNIKNGKNTNLSSNSNFKNNPNLSCIQVDNATYSTTNWSARKDANASYSDNCLALVAVSNEFEDKLIALSIDTDGKNGSVLLSSITNVTTLDVSNSSISDLSGIEYFTALETLICSGNLLPSINVSYNSALKYLDCSQNPLATLDVTKNKQLTELYCDAIVTVNKKLNSKTATNSLTTLDLSNNLLLTKLDCSNNQIVSLDVSKNTLLTDINCSNNQLTYLNLNNGNNAKLVNVNFKTNASLSCIKVDDDVYANANWSAAKDATATYSKTTCTLGITETTFETISVYPNPTKGEVHIDNVILEKATVYDALGKLGKTKTFANGSNNNSINLAGLPSGIYYIYLESQGRTVVKKIVVE